MQMDALSYAATCLYHNPELFSHSPEDAMFVNNMVIDRGGDDLLKRLAERGGLYSGESFRACVLMLRDGRNPTLSLPSGPVEAPQ